MRKIGVIGLGHVGMTVAHLLLSQGIADTLVMIDLDEKKVLAEKLDFEDAMPRTPYHTQIIIQDYQALADSDVVVTAFGDIAATVRTGDRFAEFGFNCEQAQLVAQKLKAVGFSGILLNISNPCDAITAVLQRTLGLPPHRVFGTGTFLDTARMQRSVGRYLDEDAHNIGGYVLGEHGNSQFTAWSTVTRGTQPITDFIPENALPQLEDQARQGAFAVIAGKGYTCYAIATCAVNLVKAIFSDAHLLAPVSTYIAGLGTYVGYPAIIGAAGIVKNATLHLTPDEAQKLEASANYIKTNVERGLAHSQLINGSQS